VEQHLIYKNMKILITENQLRNVQFKYLDYLFEGIHEVKSKEYPNSKFWKKNDKVVLELEEDGRLWVLRSIWNDISNMFSLEYPEINELIAEWVEQNIELENTIIRIHHITPFTEWKNV